MEWSSGVSPVYVEMRVAELEQEALDPNFEPSEGFFSELDLLKRSAAKLSLREVSSTVSDIFTYTLFKQDLCKIQDYLLSEENSLFIKGTKDLAGIKRRFSFLEPPYPDPLKEALIEHWNALEFLQTTRYSAIEYQKKFESADFSPCVDGALRWIRYLSHEALPLKVRKIDEWIWSHIIDKTATSVGKKIVSIWIEFIHFIQTLNDPHPPEYKQELSTFLAQKIIILGESTEEKYLCRLFTALPDSFGKRLLKLSLETLLTTNS